MPAFYAAAARRADGRGGRPAAASRPAPRAPPRRTSAAPKCPAVVGRRRVVADQPPARRGSRAQHPLDARAAVRARPEARQDDVAGPDGARPRRTSTGRRARSVGRHRRSAHAHALPADSGAIALADGRRHARTCRGDHRGVGSQTAPSTARSPEVRSMQFRILAAVDRRTRTATCPAACTTRPRPGSRRSRSRRSGEVPGQRGPGLPHPGPIIKEQRAELVKHHLWVLWTDYFKPPHFEKYPQLHDLFNKATKAGRRGRRQGLGRPGRGPEAARPDRRDRQDLLGDQEGAERARSTSGRCDLLGTATGAADPGPVRAVPGARERRVPDDVRPTVRCPASSASSASTEWAATRSAHRGTDCSRCSLRQRQPQAGLLAGRPAVCTGHRSSRSPRSGSLRTAELAGLADRRRSRRPGRWATATTRASPPAGDPREPRRTGRSGRRRAGGQTAAGLPRRARCYGPAGAGRCSDWSRRHGHQPVLAAAGSAWRPRRGAMSTGAPGHGSALSTVSRRAPLERPNPVRLHDLRTAGSATGRHARACQQ